MQRNKANRRAIRKLLGSRVGRKTGTKSNVKGVTRAQKVSARVSEIEKFMAWPPDGEAVTIQ